MCFKNSHQEILNLFSVIHYESLTGKNLKKIFSEALGTLNDILNMQHSFLAVYDAKKDLYSTYAIGTPRDQVTPIPDTFKIKDKSPDLCAYSFNFLNPKNCVAEDPSFLNPFPQKRSFLYPIFYGALELGFLCFIAGPSQKPIRLAKDLIKTASVLFGNLIHTQNIEERLVDNMRIIQENEAFLEKFFQDLPSPVAIIDQNQKFLKVSQAWLTYFGPTQKNSTLENYFSPDISQKLKQMIASGFIGSLPNHKEITFSQHNEQKNLDFFCSPWLEATQEVRGYVFFCHDVTTEHILKKQLNQTIQELKETNHQLDSFAAICAHDLREPLRTISNYSQVLGLEPIDSTEREEIISKITESCMNMGALIHSILKYSKMGQRSVQLAPIFLADLGEDLQKEMRALLTEKNAFLDIVDKTKRPFQADYIQIKQLFSNLIINAINYNTSKQPHVKITLEDQPSQWVFLVEDNALDFSADDAEKVNKILKSKGHPPSYSSGLGFLIINKIIKNHGGEACLKKSSAKGSVFEIKLYKKL
jgi:PAS domain S-box-containing protein